MICESSKEHGWLYRNTANFVTLARFPMCFVVAWLLFCHREWILTISSLVVLAFSTDWVDGWLARMLQISSRFGATMDRLADKTLQLTMFAFLIWDQQTDKWLRGITIPLAIIEIGLLGVWALEVWRRKNTCASKSGKIKMFLVSIAICICLANIVAEEDFGLRSSSIVVPIVVAMFTISFAFAAKSLKAHWANC